MFIYCLTNRLNGKRYVGQTRRENPMDRVKEHEEHARRPCHRKSKHPLYEAIRKQGWDTFEVSILEQVKRFEQLAPRETHWIQTLGTLEPNGYNAMLVANQSPITSIRVRRAIGNANHRIRRGTTTPYKGVSQHGKAIRVCIQKDGVSYIKTRGLKTLEDAAVYHDKLALYLYGDDAVVNFPDRRYSQQELDQHMGEHRKPTKTSSFIGVHWANGDQRWHSSVNDAQFGKGRTKTLKMHKTEVEAAECRDLAVIHYGIEAPLNFPDRREEFLARLRDNPTLFRKRRLTLKRNVKKSYNRYEGRFTHLGKSVACGRFDTEDEAFAAVQAKKRELGIPC